MKMSKSLVGWELHMRSGRYATCTIKGYLQTMRKIVTFLNDPDAADVTVWDLESYLSKRRDDGVSESTRQTEWKVIKAYYKWASMKKGLGIPRPDTELEMPRTADPEIQPYTKDEIMKLLRACKMTRPAKTEKRESWTYLRKTAFRDQLIILILLDTGVRVSELCRIQYKDLNLSTQSIHIRSFESGLKSRDRLVYLGDTTMDILWKITVENEDPENYLIPSSISKRNRPMDRYAIGHLLRSLGEKAGVPHVGAHRFRHTFAVEYLRNGGDIYTLKRQLGHNSLAMVQRYLALSETDAQKAHRKASPVDNWC